MHRLLFLSSVIAVVFVASSTATAPPQLPVSDLLTAAGHVTLLHSGVTYGASQFPLQLRVTPPDGSWSGAQWKTARLIGGRGGPPIFGWAAVAQGPRLSPPKGLIVIMTAEARTPSLAATVAGLRSRGHGASYEASSPTRVAGFSGVQFDGRLVGTKHLFVPFSPPSNAGGAYPGIRDAFQIGGEVGGSVFRVIVLNVRGKTVVVYLENAALPADQFPTFLVAANQVLRSLRFTG